MDGEDRQPHDELGRLILQGMRDRGLSYGQLGAMIGGNADANKVWLHRLVNGKVKLTHGENDRNRERLAAIVRILDLDEDEVAGAVAERHLVSRPAKGGEYDWVTSLDGRTRTLVKHWEALGPADKAKVWALVERVRREAEARDGTGATDSDS